jgi:NTE family protein
MQNWFGYDVFMNERAGKHLLRTLYSVLSLHLLTACANYGAIQNQAIDSRASVTERSLEDAIHSGRSNEVTIALSFSGGGTRAAALAYGVLLALRDSPVKLGKDSSHLFDEIDAISSVSGGSFTAAFFGLHGEDAFDDFEETFLRRDVEAVLKRRLLYPSLTLTSKSRTEMAIEYYDEILFHQATFADLHSDNGPLVIINATDLGNGVRFSFLQEYFGLLCSDLSSFSVSRAVTASSAFPIVFNPVVLRNYGGCDSHGQRFLQQQHEQLSDSPMMQSVTSGLGSFAHKDKKPYVHLVDGGISDNLGLLAMYEMVESAGGIKPFLDLYQAKPAPRFVVISVNASTSPFAKFDLSNKSPSVGSTISAMSNIQLHRTNAATLELLKNSAERWSQELSTPETTVQPYFVEIDFNGIAQTERRDWLNQVPTGFTLSGDQVDGLIEAGKELLLNNPEFQRFLTDLKSDETGYN